MATSLDSSKQRLAQAQEAARKRATREAVGPEWPKVDQITLAEAMECLTYEVLCYGARVSFGNTAGSADVWCRLNFPVECDSPLAGLVAFTSSTSIDRAARKAAQLLDATARKAWKPDQFAK